MFATCRANNSGAESAVHLWFACFFSSALSLKNHLSCAMHVKNNNLFWYVTVEGVWYISCRGEVWDGSGEQAQGR